MQCSKSVMACYGFVYIASILGAEPTEAERAAIAYRRSLRTCQVELVSETWRLQNGELRKASETVYDLKCDEEKSRTDRDVSRYHTGASAVPLVTERTIKNGSEVVRRNIDLNDPKKRFAFNIYHIDRPDVWSMARSNVFDPRVLGLSPVPFGILYGTSYSSFVGCENRQDSQEREVLENGRRLVAVEYKHGGKTARMKIDPQQGYSLISGELDDGHKRSSIVCELEKYPSGNIWFPKCTTYELSVNGSVSVRNVVKVTSARFNEVIDPQVFTIAALGIEPGTPAAETPPPETTRIWNGNALVSYGSPMPVVVHKSRSQAIITGAVGSVAAAVGFLLLSRIYAKKGQKSGGK